MKTGTNVRIIKAPNQTGANHTGKKENMSEEAITIAVEYLRRIAPMFQASVLKILYAYAEKSK